MAGQHLAPFALEDMDLPAASSLGGLADERPLRVAPRSGGLMLVDCVYVLVGGGSLGPIDALSCDLYSRGRQGRGEDACQCTTGMGQAGYWCVAGITAYVELRALRWKRCARGGR